VRHGNMDDVATNVIDVCNGVDVEVTLLKGISIADQYYPSAHLRPMTDIDILVSQHEQQRVQLALLRRGYVPKTGDWPEDSHHAAPLLHPEKRVWAEVHSVLFPANASVVKNGICFA